MDIYQYHPVTKAFIGAGAAQLDPVASTKKKPVYLTPAHATTVAPPAPAAGNAAVFDPATDTWSEVEDHRGTVYDTATGTSSEHADLGALPAGLTDLQPGPFDTWDGAAWVFDPAKGAANRLTQIAADCRKAITAGIACNALGTDHTYPTSAQDQANLAAQVLAAQVNGVPGEPYKFWCADAAGVWARRGHTAAEIVAAGEAVRMHVSAAQDQYEARGNELDTLVNTTGTTKADIAAVKWI